MALIEVVDLIRLHLLNDADQVGAVGEVAVMEGELRGLARAPRASPGRGDRSAGVERGGAPLDPIDLQPQQLRKVLPSCPVMPLIKAVLGGGCGHRGLVEVLGMSLRDLGKSPQEVQEGFRSSRGSFTREGDRSAVQDISAAASEKWTHNDCRKSSGREQGSTPSTA